MKVQLFPTGRKKTAISLPFPCACLYELGAASEIPAVEYCKDGICTSLGTPMQGMYT